MRRLRSSMVLLVLCIVAIVAAGLRIATDEPDLPAGSSHSAQPDGAEALFVWAEGEGAAPTRVTQARAVETATPQVLLVLEPEEVVSDRTQRAFSTVARQGGTLVLAGDSLPLSVYARELDVTIEPAAPTSTVTAVGSERELSVRADHRVRADDATPLLVAPNGDWIALQKRYQRGSVIVIASVEPLTNAGLRDTNTARFVYREIVEPAIGNSLGFDEVHHSYTPAADEGPTVNTLLFDTAPGRAVVVAAVLAFAYLLLAGRRLGPSLPPRPPASMRRTMFEHVQMLAGLYRRAAQFDVLRARLAHHYTRMLARGTLAAPRATRLADAAEAIKVARSESELVAVVGRADEVLSAS
jgi:hypothetical protein